MVIEWKQHGQAQAALKGENNSGLTLGLLRNQSILIFILEKQYYHDHL